MECLNFLNTIYFIRDYIRTLIKANTHDNLEVSEEPFSNIDDAISYYSSDPIGLIDNIMSSDISLLEIQAPETNIKDHTILLRRFAAMLERDASLTSYIDANIHNLYLRNYILEGSTGDIRSSIESFFSLARRFLVAYKGVPSNDVNYRLSGSIASNLIRVKEVFAGIEFNDTE